MAVNINVPSQVKTYANLAAFPASGALKTIYIAEDTNKTYRWTGSVYVEVSASASGITIGTTAITSGTVGRVLFQGTGNVVSQSANLFWDNTNGTLEATTTADNLFGLRLISTTGQLRVKPYLNPTYGVLLESKTANASANLPLTLSGSRLLLADGNVLINTTTDAGFRLDVNGTARVQGNSFEVTNGATNRIVITSAQISCLSGVAVNNLNVVAGPISMPNSILGIGTTVSGGTTSTLVIGSGNATNSSGIVTIGQSSRGFAPTSGTATFSFLTWDGTINQTGTANGAVRGFYYNPTLTSVLGTHHAFHSTSGRIRFENLPTSATGLSAGDIWNDAGTLKIV